MFSCLCRRKSQKKYTITNNILGYGATSVVYLANENKTEKKVACKIISKEDYFEHSSLVKIECKILKTLNHPNIVKFYDVGEDSKHIYIYMEVVNGSDLTYFEMDKANEKDIKIIFRQIVDAVEYCHKKGVVIRDIKLENIMYDINTKKVKLVDFGLSDYMFNSRIFRISEIRLDKLCGTIGYAPPEICNGYPYKGKPVDIWCMGIVLYILLQGRMPFTDDDTEKTLEKTINEELSFDKNIGEDAKELISGMLTKDPKIRYTIRDIKESRWFRLN